MRIILVLLLFFPAVSFALDYSWQLGGFVRPTPAEACNAFRDSVLPGRKAIAEKQYVDRYVCQIYKADGVTVERGDYIYRQGNSCPSGYIYNSQTGLCDPPPEPENPCEEKAGEMARSVQNMGQDFPLTVGANIISACVDGCSVPMATQVKCSTSAKTWDTFCLFAGVYDGQQCEASPGADPSPCVGDSCEAPEPATETEEQPCTYVEDAEGRKHCSSSTATYSDGSQNCGTVDGVTTCYPKVPGSSEKTDIDTTVSTTANPDGSSTTTKKDTATTTKCSGANSCSSTTTTTTTVISKDAAGNTTSSSTSCTGSDCGDAESDSSGGDTGNCPPGEECAPQETFDAGELEEVPGFGESLGTFMDSVERAPLVTAVTSITVAGGGCHFPSASTPIGTISMGPFCDLASVLDNLRAVFLAMWGLAAIRILMSA